MFNFLKRKPKILTEDDLAARMPFYMLDRFEAISYDLILKKNENKEDYFTLMLSFYIENKETKKYDKGFKLITHHTGKTRDDLAKIVSIFYWSRLITGSLKTHTVGTVYGENFTYENDWEQFGIFDKLSNK